MDQLCLFEEKLYWLPFEDNECRMWECCKCHRRMIGAPLHWHQYNFYKFCPYCGQRLYVKDKNVETLNDLGDNY